jgi:hypothetical protein
MEDLWLLCGYNDCEESRLTACCCRLIFGSLKTDNFSLGLQVNTHITPRPILLTRHGESQDNIRGRIGGDPPLRYFSFFESVSHDIYFSFRRVKS